MPASLSTTAELSLPNVSLLYRYGLLAKALKLSVRDLIALKQLSGLDPFKPLHADPLATLEEDHPFSQTLRFVEIAEEVKESGLKIEDLDYLLRHRFDETGKYRPEPRGHAGPAQDAGRGRPRHPRRARRTGRSGRVERRGAAAEAGSGACRPMWSNAFWR